jgi:hypothetical protein
MKVCKLCNKVCQPLIPLCKPENGEWYCANCHKSYKMSDEEIRQYLPMVQQKYGRKS